MKNRIHYISFLQVIGPVLVILGHSTNSMPSSDWYYVFTKEWIYLFHMPLFFFVSGYLFTFKGGLKNTEYDKFIKNKFKRLIYPYLFWNISFIIPKLISQGYIDDNISFNLNTISELLLVPRQNILGHTWFLVALFIIFTFSFIYDNLFFKNYENKRYIILMVSFLTVTMYMFPIPTDIFALRDISKNFVFFWTGMLLGKVEVNYIFNVLQKKFTFIILSIVTLLFTIVTLQQSSVKIISLITAISTILLLFSLPIYFNIKNEIIEKLAKTSFDIYILHWPFMILTRIILFQIMKMNYIIVILMMIITGYFGPLLVKKIIEQKHINGKLRTVTGI